MHACDCSFIHDVDSHVLLGDHRGHVHIVPINDMLKGDVDYDKVMKQGKSQAIVHHHEVQLDDYNRIVRSVCMNMSTSMNM